VSPVPILGGFPGSAVVPTASVGVSPAESPIQNWPACCVSPQAPPTDGEAAESWRDRIITTISRMAVSMILPCHDSAIGCPSPIPRFLVAALRYQSRARVFSDTADDSPSPGGEGRGELEHYTAIHILPRPQDRRQRSAPGDGRTPPLSFIPPSPLYAVFSLRSLRSFAASSLLVAASRYQSRARVFSATADDSPSPGGEGRGELEHYTAIRMTCAFSTKFLSSVSPRRLCLERAFSSVSYLKSAVDRPLFVSFVCFCSKKVFMAAAKWPGAHPQKSERRTAPEAPSAGGTAAPKNGLLWQALPQNEPKLG